MTGNPEVEKLDPWRRIKTYIREGKINKEPSSPRSPSPIEELTTSLGDDDKRPRKQLSFKEPETLGSPKLKGRSLHKIVDALKGRAHNILENIGAMVKEEDSDDDYTTVTSSIPEHLDPEATGPTTEEYSKDIEKQETSMRNHAKQQSPSQQRVVHFSSQNAQKKKEFGDVSYSQDVCGQVEISQMSPITHSQSVISRSSILRCAGETSGNAAALMRVYSVDETGCGLRQEAESQEVITNDAQINKRGKLERETHSSLEDDELSSQAMRIVRTVGQAFEVCHKLNIQHVQHNSDGQDDGESEQSDLSDKKDQSVLEDSYQTADHCTSSLRPSILDPLPPPPTSDSNNIEALAEGETFTSPTGDPLSPFGMVPSAGTPLSVHHELQLLKEQLEQQGQQTQVAVAQMHLLRDQLAAETAARLEAQARNHQLLVHNRELLEHIQVLVLQLQEIENKLHQVHGQGDIHNVTLIPQMPILCEATTPIPAQLKLLTPCPIVDSDRQQNSRVFGPVSPRLAPYTPQVFSFSPCYVTSPVLRMGSPKHSNDEILSNLISPPRTLLRQVTGPITPGGPPLTAPLINTTFPTRPSLESVKSISTLQNSIQAPKLNPPPQKKRSSPRNYTSSEDSVLSSGDAPDAGFTSEDLLKQRKNTLNDNKTKQSDALIELCELSLCDSTTFTTAVTSSSYSASLASQRTPMAASASNGPAPLRSPSFHGTSLVSTQDAVNRLQKMTWPRHTVGK